jgi:hypothetical protein
MLEKTPLHDFEPEMWKALQTAWLVPEQTPYHDYELEKWMAVQTAWLAQDAQAEQAQTNRQSWHAVPSSVNLRVANHSSTLSAVC